MKETEILVINLPIKKTLKIWKQEVQLASGRSEIRNRCISSPYQGPMVSHIFFFPSLYCFSFLFMRNMSQICPALPGLLSILWSLISKFSERMRLIHLEVYLALDTYLISPVSRGWLRRHFSGKGIWSRLKMTRPQAYEASPELILLFFIPFPFGFLLFPRTVAILLPQSWHLLFPLLRRLFP